MELNEHLLPLNSPIAQNQGAVSSYKFDSDNEAGVISSSKIRNASIGTAKISAFSFNQGTGGTITLGGTANGNGVMQILNAIGGTVVTANNQGITISNGSITIKNTDGITVLDNQGLVSSAAFESDSFIDFSQYDTSSTTFVDLGTEELTFNLDRQTQVLVFFYVEGYNDNADTCNVQIYDSLLASELVTTALTGVFDTLVDWDEGTGLINFVDYFVYAQPISNIGIFNLDAGVHTIKLQFKSDLSGESSILVNSIGYVILGT